MKKGETQKNILSKNEVSVNTISNHKKQSLIVNIKPV